MIRLHLNGNPIANDLIIADIDVASCTYKIEGKEPAAVFDQLVSLDWDWRLEISPDEEDSELAARWESADITSRIVRALKKGKTVLLAQDSGDYVRITSIDQAAEELAEFYATYWFMPLVLTDDSAMLRLGFQPERVAAQQE